MPAIVTVTSAYYTTGTDPGAAWTNEELVWDSTITGSTGALMMCATKGVSNTAKNLLSSGNNLSTAAGDPITKVEIGYRGKIYNANQVVYLQPIFGGSSVGDAIMIDPVTTNWQTLYTDITTVAGAPATWTRQAIADLDVNLYGYSSAKTASASTLVIDAVLIKVTETSGIVNALAYYTTASTTIDKITDDEFDNSSIGVQWTQSTNTGASITETTELKIVSALSCVTEIVYGPGGITTAFAVYYPKTGLYSTSVTGDFLIEMKVRNFEVSTAVGGGIVCPYVGMFISSALGTATAISYNGIVVSISSNFVDGRIYNVGELLNTTGMGPSWSMVEYSTFTSFPIYMRLGRTGSTVYCSYSTNGTTWSSNWTISTMSTAAGYFQFGCYNRGGLAYSAIQSTAYIDYVKDASLDQNVTTTVGIYESTSGMTKGLPVYVSNKQGYIRLEPTSAYAGDKGTRMRVQAEDGIIYTVCATTS